MVSRQGDPNLGTRQRRKVCAEVKRTESICHLCGLGIDLALDPQRHPHGFTVDELVPRCKGGSAYDRGNLRAAHRSCNSRRNDRDLTPDVYDECRRAMTALGPRRTSRNW